MQMTRQSEALASSTTLGVSLHVQSQMVASAEAAIAVAALEGFSSSVFAVMASQLVRSCESPFAALPWAFVGFFSWKNKWVNELSWVAEIWSLFKKTWLWDNFLMEAWSTSLERVLGTKFGKWKLKSFEKICQIVSLEQ